MTRIVLDTNVFVSAVLLPLSTPRYAVDKALDQGAVLFSGETMGELSEVLSRPKFDRYITPNERAIFLSQIKAAAELVTIVQLVRECHDPTDDKFLEVALNGSADVIVTGDVNLLKMHLWRGIAILSPADYLK